MTKISAFTALQDKFGKEQAQALAEFIEVQDGPDMSRFATKDDLQGVQNDLKDLELRLIKEIAKVREELSREIAKTREDLTKEIAKTREDMITRMNWTTIIQALTTVGALVALAKVF